MTGKVRILIVEDEASTAEDLSISLTDFGYEVVGKVNTAEDAIDKTFELDPDIVLMDTVLKGEKTGLDAAVDILKKRHQLFVFLSAFTDTNLLDKVKVVRPYGYLIKPYQDSQLLATIKMALHSDLIEKESEKHSKRLEKLVERRTKKLISTQGQLARKERLALLGQISGSIGHELRDPLGVISNAIYYLQSTIKENGKVKEYLGVIESEVRRAENIVTNLLSFSHSGVADRQDILILSAVNWALGKQAFTEKVKVVVEVDPTLKAFIDLSHLESILNNLITNACQAMSDGGVLRVEAHKENQCIILSVSDTGKGISREDVKSLFEPLYTTKPKGVGLGLSITKNLVEANGGLIEVKSRLGKGSKFSISFPVGKQGTC